MSHAEHYSHNLGRAFPLQFDGSDDLFGLLSDAKFFIDPESGYTHGEHVVWLSEINRLSPQQQLLLGAETEYFAAIKCSSPHFANAVGIAVFPGDPSSFAEVRLQVYALNSWASFFMNKTLVSIPPVESGLLFSGWVVFGDELDEYRQVGDVTAAFEPSRVVVTQDVSARSGRTWVYNRPTAGYSPPAGCEHVGVIDVGNSDYQLICGPFETNLEIRGGYQTSVSQNPIDNTIVVGSSIGGGEVGDGCNIPTLEELVDDQAPQCDEVLRRINGLEGPQITLRGRQGVAVEPHPELNRVIVSLGTRDVRVCTATTTEDQQVEYIPTNADGIVCGDNASMPLVPGIPDSSTGYSIVVTPDPDPIDGPDYCVWRASGDEWTLETYPCQSPDGCSSPSRGPLASDEVLQTVCLPTLVSSGVIRNGDFDHAVPQSGWNFYSDAEVVQTHGTIEPSYLPLVRLDGSAEIEQVDIQVATADYILQADHMHVDGDIIFELLENGSDTVLATYSPPIAAYPPQTTAFPVIRLNAGEVRLRIRYSGSGEAFVGFISLIQQT